MPLESPHIDYALHLPAWRKIRDCIAGEDCIKAGADRYVPKPSGMTTEQFQAYVERGMFFGASARTVQGLHGAMFRRDPEITMPPGEQYENLVQNIDLAGTPLTVFASMACEDEIAIGRIGILTDMTPSGEPYLVFYIAENIFNWRERTVGNVPVPDQFILKETYQIPAKDGFGSENRTRFRVLELDEENMYRVRVFTRPDMGGEFVEEVFEPKLRGQRLTYIPFNVVSPAQLELAIRKSPIKELVDVNISHWRTSCDLEHGAHWTALPTPWVAADLGDKPPALNIGSLTAWVLPSQSQVGMLTLKGDDLGALFKMQEAKENKMAQLGARLLEDQKKAAETAESKRLQYSGENSVLASIANTLSRALTLNLRWAVEWMGGNPDDVEVKINTDFFDMKMEPTELTALFTVYQGGGMSLDTFLHNLQRGEVLPPGRTPEDEMDKMLEEGPNFGPGAVSPPPPPADQTNDASNEQVAA